MTTGFFRCIFVAQNLNNMKKKNEEKLPEQGYGDKVAVEKETTNEVVENETFNEEAAEERQEEEEDDSPDDEEVGCIDIHASRKEFLEFLSKLLHMMKEIVILEKRLREFEKDPTFDMLMDLCMVELEKMKESDEEKDPSEEKDESSKEDSDDDDEETITETFISMKVKKLKV